MEINNNPALQYVPAILGEINASRKQQISTDKVAIDDKGQGQNPGQSSPGVISESEKQSARQQFENNFQQASQGQVTRDKPNGSDSRAIRAYLSNEESDQKDYLSNVLGIDLRV